MQKIILLEIFLSDSKGVLFIFFVIFSISVVITGTALYINVLNKEAINYLTI